MKYNVYKRFTTPFGYYSVLSEGNLINHKSKFPARSLNPSIFDIRTDHTAHFFFILQEKQCHFNRLHDPILKTLALLNIKYTLRIGRTLYQLNS